MDSLCVGEQNQHARVQETRYESGEQIIVPEADLIDRNGVVLIDDRNDTVCQ
jgi:hypothetical protein